MANNVTYWTYGDTKSDLIFTVAADDGTLPDLNSVSTVTFKLKASGGSLISLTGAVHDVSTAKVRWRPSADQSDYGSGANKIPGAGSYDVQVYVVWNDGREETYPRKGSHTLVVKAQLS